MDWVLVAGCVILGWVMLAVLSGERLRLLDEHKARVAREEAAQNAAKPQ